MSQYDCVIQRSIQIEAWRRGAFAIHEVKDGARITHAPTGLTIWTTSFFDEAAEVAEAIEGLTDWSSIKEAAPIGGDLYKRMRHVILELELEKCW